MELKQVIEKRQSIRSFTSEPVAIEDIKEMVRRAGLAPSLDNSQPWRFIAITNSKLLKRMASQVSKCINELPVQDKEDLNHSVLSRVEWFSTFFRDAPAVIALAMQNHEGMLERGTDISPEEIARLRNYPDLQSAGAAIQNILLTAVEKGYGACWLSAPMIAKNELEIQLKLGDSWHLITMVALGRPFNHPDRKHKKPVEEIFEIIS
jgi:nitroreductase